MAQYQQQYEQGLPQHQQTYTQPPQQTYAQPPQQTTYPADVKHTYTPPQAMDPNQMPVAPAPVHPNHDHTQHSHAAHSPSEKLADAGKSKWAFSVWDCFKPLDLCCLACWCPCVIFGRTYQRNKTGEQDPSGLNGMCCAWYAVTCCTGCGWVLQFLQRSETRQKHSIEGDSVKDFLLTACCGCCTLVQEEKESIVRVTGMDPITKTAYQAVPQMTYT